MLAKLARRMENCHGFVLLLTTGILQSAILLSECAPLPYSDTGKYVFVYSVNVVNCQCMLKTQLLSSSVH